MTYAILLAAMVLGAADAPGRLVDIGGRKLHINR